MAKSPADPQAALRRQLDTGASGRLVVKAGDREIRLYLTFGSIMGAESDRDDREVVDRLVEQGRLNDSEAARLLGAVGQASVVPELSGRVDETTLQDVLYRRFRENLATFIGTKGRAKFEPLEFVMPPNLQLTHETPALLEELQAVVRRVTQLAEDDPVLGFGALAPRTPAEVAVLDRVQGSTRVSEVVRSSPYERHDTLELLADMLDAGVLARATAQVPVEARSEDEVTDPGRSGPTAPRLDREGLSKGPDEHVSQEELAMFADHDTVRGGGAGTFVKANEELDRIDLSGVIDRGADAEVVEVGEHDGRPLDGPVARVQMNFSGPRLTNDEALKKIEVVNQVLGTLSQAFDTARGQGMGPSQVQLLLDGSPATFAVLYHQVEARADGSINPNAILHNLRRRPAAEHRRLLNRGLLDLIERALGAAAEDLDEPVLDGMLEQIAGYQQRLGL